MGIMVWLFICHLFSVFFFFLFGCFNVCLPVCLFIVFNDYWIIHELTLRAPTTQTYITRGSPSIFAAKTKRTQRASKSIAMLLPILNSMAKHNEIVNIKCVIKYNARPRGPGYNKNNDYKFILICCCRFKYTTQIENHLLSSSIPCLADIVIK